MLNFDGQDAGIYLSGVAGNAVYCIGVDSAPATTRRQVLRSAQDTPRAPSDFIATVDRARSTGGAALAPVPAVLLADPSIRIAALPSPRGLTPRAAPGPAVGLAGPCCRVADALVVSASCAPGHHWPR